MQEASSLLYTKCAAFFRLFFFKVPLLLEYISKIGIQVLPMFFCSEFVRITLYLLLSDLTREISLWSIYLEVVFVKAQSEQCAAIQRARGSASGMVVTWQCMWS